MKDDKKDVEEIQEVNLLDVLLDEDNDDPITVYDENDKPVRFDQVAIIPFKEVICYFKAN